MYLCGAICVDAQHPRALSVAVIASATTEAALLRTSARLTGTRPRHGLSTARRCWPHRRASREAWGGMWKRVLDSNQRRPGYGPGVLPLN